MCFLMIMYQYEYHMDMDGRPHRFYDTQHTSSNPSGGKTNARTLFFHPIFKTVKVTFPKIQFLHCRNGVS